MDKIEWTLPKVVYVLFFWCWGVIGAGVFLYGMYQFGFLHREEQFRFVLIGVAVIFVGGVFATIGGKIIRRYSNHK